LEKYAFFSQVPGTLLKERAVDNSSISSVILRAPVSPSFKSSKEFLISAKRLILISIIFSKKIT